MSAISSSQMGSSKTQLITIDSQQKLCYFQGCKVKINKIAKCLLMEPEAENVKVFVANFDQSFYRFKNILCILDVETNIYNFMLITRNEESCEKAFNAIQKQKSVNVDNLPNDKLFEQLIYPIINGIQYNEVLKAQIMPIITKLLECLKNEDRQKCHEYLKQKEIDESFINEIFKLKNGSKSKNTRKRTLRNQTAKDIIVARKNGSRNSNRILIDDIINESDNESSPPHKRKRIQIANDKEDETIIKPPNFKIITSEEKGYIKKRLYIFSGSDKSKCYEYHWETNYKRFNCFGCGKKKKIVSTNIFKENGQEYVKFNKAEHICELRDYNPEKFCDSSKIIDASNFKLTTFVQNGFTKSRLFIFSKDDRNVGYEYFWAGSMKVFRCGGCDIHKKHVNAVIQKDKDGKDFVKLGNAPHVCEMRNFVSAKYDFDPEKRIIEASNFEVYNFDDKGIPRKWIIIFAENDRTKCYEYAWSKTIKKYECRGCACKRKRVNAELCQKDDGTEFIKLGPQEHICEYRKYNPAKFTAEKNVESGNFEIVKFEENGIAKQRLFIFTNSEKSKCYEYYYRKHEFYYKCSACEGMNKHTGAKVEEKDGKKFLRLLSPGHVCEPKGYAPEKYSNDPSKYTVEKPNFEVINYEKNGISKSMLIIFCRTNKQLCYEYFLDKTENHYVCCGCANVKHLTAKICQNEAGEGFIKLNKAEHVCDLRPYAPEKFTDYLTVEKDNYAISEYTDKGISSKRLFIFTSNAKELCYKFCYNSSNSTFYCSKCCYKSHSVIAFLRKHENGEEYISLSNRQHICEPIKYQPKKRISAESFQLLKRKYATKIIQKLIIFTDPNKKMCYEYRLSGKYYTCAACHKKFHRHVSARVIQISEGEFVELGYAEHKCKPTKFLPEGSINFEIIKKPNFKLEEFKTKKILSIFVKNDATKCFTYQWKQSNNCFQCYPCRGINESHRVIAWVKKDENGEDYVVPNENKHICKPKKYQQHVEKIIEAPNFEILTKIENGKEIQSLKIFYSDDKKTFRKYFFDKHEHCFRCSKCNTKNKYVSAKLMENVNGENYLKMGKNEHFCKPEKA